MKDMQWSKTEKAIAKKAFDSAYERECQTIMVELRKLASEAQTPEDIWKIHDYLGRTQRNMGKKYDYRYSMLIFGFAQLLMEGWITEDELNGLREDKIEKIRFIVSRKW